MTRTIVLCLIGIAIPLAGLGYWGMFTEQGQRKYDEMAGIIPMAEMALAVILLFAAGLIMLMSRKKK